MKVAIVCDWLIAGGGERVVEELHKLYPDAPIYTSYCTPQWRKKLDDKVITGYLQKWPFSKLRRFLPVLRIWWFGKLDFSEYDMVISSSGNGEAKGIKTPEQVIHVSYCFTPTHFYWRHYQQYLDKPGFGFFNPLVRLGLKLLVEPLKRWDYKAAQRANHVIAISEHIKQDVKTYYNRESIVIHPPVNVERFNKEPLSEPRKGFLTAGRQVPMKKFDLIIEAFNHIGLSLKVIGRGPEHQNLARMARPNIQVLENISDLEMPKLFLSAEAFIFASHEDFGITPVEAMSAGTPVLAYKRGGAIDYIIPGKTGEFFDEQTVDSLTTAIKKFDPKKYDNAAIRKHAENFSAEVFRKSIHDFVNTVVNK